MNNDKTMGSCDTPACCFMDIGTVMDGTDCSAQLQRLVANGDEAAAVLAEWTALANSKASEPVSVAHQRRLLSQQDGDARGLVVTQRHGIPCGRDRANVRGGHAVTPSASAVSTARSSGWAAA